MKRIAIILAVVFTQLSLTAQDKVAYRPDPVSLDTLERQPLRSVTNNAFKAGEKLTYTVHYGWVDAGEAVLEVKESPWNFSGREAYNIVGTGRSLGAFNWVFKVRDRYETYIDKEGIFPYRFIRDVDEGGYEINQDYVFFPDKRAVKTQEDTVYATPDFVQDMLSSFYYARTLDFSNVKSGDVFTIMTIVDEEVFPMKIKFLKRETISLRKGDFRCLKFVPVIQEGRIFKDQDDLNVWITDDDNHVTVLAKASILVGSIKMELTDYEGLSHPIAKEDD